MDFDSLVQQEVERRLKAEEAVRDGLRRRQIAFEEIASRIQRVLFEVVLPEFEVAKGKLDKANIPGWINDGRKRGGPDGKTEYVMEIGIIIDGTKRVALAYRGIIESACFLVVFQIGEREEEKTEASIDSLSRNRVNADLAVLAEAAFRG